MSELLDALLTGLPFILGWEFGGWLARRLRGVRRSEEAL